MPSVQFIQPCVVGLIFNKLCFIVTGHLIGCLYADFIEIEEALVKECLIRLGVRDRVAHSDLSSSMHVVLDLLFNFIYWQFH